MRKILEDFLSEDFTTEDILCYGVLYPLAMIVIVLTATLLFS